MKGFNDSYVSSSQVREPGFVTNRPCKKLNITSKNIIKIAIILLKKTNITITRSMIDKIRQYK